MAVSDVKIALDSFLNSDEPRAIALTGNWGRGKTFFWKAEIEEFLRDRNIGGKVKYSYVSLFGISSMAELKDAIFENVVSSTDVLGGATEETLRANADSLAGEQGAEAPIRDASCSSRMTSWFRRQTDQGLSNGRKHFSLLKAFPGLDRLGPFARSAAFLSIRQHIICFDDIERRGKGLEAGDVFGLISLLKEQRQCKVIAILNGDALVDADRTEYDSFREKVFDAEVKYSPSPLECANLVFGENDRNLVFASECSQRLGITNVRILQRIRRAMEVLIPKVQSYENAIARQVIQSLVLLAWCYNSKEFGTPSYQHVKGLGYVDFLSLKDSKERPKEEVKWNELLKAYGYQNTDDLDSQICFYLENGFLVNERFLGAVESINASVLQSKAQGAFSDIWDIYHGSFKDNEADLVKAIKDRLLEGAKWISVTNVDGVVRLLRELKRNDFADELVNRWIEVTGRLDVEKLNLEAEPLSRHVEDESFRKKLAAAFMALRGRPTLDAVIRKIAEGGGWNAVVDEQVLSAASPKDFYHFFKSIDDRSLHKYVKACLQFGAFVNVSEAQLRIAENAKDALRKIGVESELNRIRVRGFGVEVPEASGDSTL